MDALKFIEERNRMCGQYWQADGCCDGCPLVYTRDCNEMRNMVDDSGKAVRKVVEIIEKWSKEHPRKTRQDVFLEQYPEVYVKDGCLVICPNGISPWHRGEDGECIAKIHCKDCHREFWMQEVAMMMALLKIARAKAGTKADTYIDLAGYAACAAEISAQEPKRTAKRKDITSGVAGGTEPEKTASCVKLQRMDGYYLVEVDGNPHRFTLLEAAMQFIHDQTAEERKKKT